MQDKQFNIKNRDIVWSIDGEMYLVDYPDSEFAARILAWALEGLPEETWNDVKCSRSARWATTAAECIASSRRASKLDIVGWYNDPFPVRVPHKHGNRDLAVSGFLSAKQPTRSKVAETDLLCSVKGHGLEVYDTNRGMAVYNTLGVMLKHRIGIRPVLIPMVNGKPCKERLSKLHPNGTLLDRGTFYYMGKPRFASVTEEDLNDRMVSWKIDSETEYCVDNSCDEDKRYLIQWVVWEGCLFPVKNLFYVPTRSITDVFLPL